MRQRIIISGIIVLFAALLTAVIAHGAQRVQARPLAPEDATDNRPTAQAADPLPAAAVDDPTIHCRYGVNNRGGLPANQWITTLGAGFYLNFNERPNGPPVPDTVDFVPQVRMQQQRANGVLLPTYVLTPTLTFDANGLGTAVLEQPGHLWLVGNEPDVDNPDQDRMLPQLYAQVYHDVYHFIKALDPTAHVAIAGLSMMTPGRMQYLDIVWDTYQQRYGEPMPVDVWNFHLYILAEIDPNKVAAGLNNVYADGKIALGTDPALAKRAPLGGQPLDAECAKEDVYCRAEHDSLPIFIEQVRNMRQWMKDHGQQNKPLILSEWSILYPYLTFPDGSCDFLRDEFGNCFTPQRVSTYMQRTLDYLTGATDPNLGYPADDFRLVQQWKWYSLYAEPEWSGGSSNLVQGTFASFAPGDAAALTQMGRTFRQYVAAQTTSVNLVAGAAYNHVGYVGADGDGAALLDVGFHNSGTTGVTRPFLVTFYADAGLTQEIGRVTVDNTVNGCAWGRNTDRARLVWRGLRPGTHRYWAKIDSGNEITAETNERDNITSGVVKVYARTSYAPVVAR